jgi:hypothetical protein
MGRTRPEPQPGNIGVCSGLEAWSARVTLPAGGVAGAAICGLARRCNPCIIAGWDHVLVCRTVSPPFAAPSCFASAPGRTMHRRYLYPILRFLAKAGGGVRRSATWRARVTGVYPGSGLYRSRRLLLTKWDTASPPDLLTSPEGRPIISISPDQAAHRFWSAMSDFYDQLAPVYHLIYQDWNASLLRQGARCLLPRCKAH